MRELSSKTIVIIMIVLIAIIMTSAFYFDGRFDIKDNKISFITEKMIAFHITFS